MSAALWTGDIVIPQGATEGSSWPRSWALVEGTPPRAPANWPDGWTAEMQIRRRISDEAVAAQISLTLDIVDVTVKGVPTRAARVLPNITPETSAEWTWTNGVYDVKLYGPDDRVIRLAQGRVRLDRGVTRD